MIDELSIEKSCNRAMDITIDITIDIKKLLCLVK